MLLDLGLFLLGGLFMYLHNCDREPEKEDDAKYHLMQIEDFIGTTRTVATQTDSPEEPACEFEGPQALESASPQACELGSDSSWTEIEK
jgi:hypothetical protein